MQTDNYGNCYIGGSFGGRLLYDNDTVVNFKNQSAGMDICCINPQGKLMWVIGWPEFSPDFSGINPRIHDAAVINEDSIYFTGFFYEKAIIDTFHLDFGKYSSNIFNGKLGIPGMRHPDSFAYAYSCSGPYNFKLYYHTRPDSVKWEFGDGSISKQINPQHTYTSSGTYNVKITAWFKNGSIWIRNKTIYYNNLKSKILPNDTLICPGAAIKLDASHIGVSRWHWSDGYDSASRIVKKAGTYKVTLYSGKCATSDSIRIYDNSKIKITTDTAICEGKTIPVNLKDYFGNIQWSDGSNVKYYTISRPGNYGLTLSDPCQIRSYSITVKDSNCYCPIYTPNTFSPDDNGLNDFFKPVPTCTAEQYLLRVYNRWGQMLYQSTDPNSAGWDGSYNHSPCPEGVYMYTLYYKARDNKYYRHGSVQLLRD